MAIARGAIYFSLHQMGEEICDRLEKLRQHEPDADQITLYRMALTEPGGMSDFICAPGRTVLVTCLLSLFWFWCEDEGWPNEKFKLKIEEFLPVPMMHLLLWGEGVLPQILIHFWHWGKVDATQKSNFAIEHVLGQMLHQATDSSSNGIPSPYYTYEDVIKHANRRIFSRFPDKLEREDFKNTSFVAEGVLHLLVRTNLKTRCKIHWPAFSRVMGMEFRPKERWQFCLLKCEHGKTVQIQHAPMKKWEDLKTEARSIACPAVPPTMLDDRYLLMLFAVVFPHRFTPAMIRYLGYRFSDVWFLKPPTH